MRCKFDRVVVSTDENENFIQFIPIVSKAWKKFFPDAYLTIALVSDRSGDDLFVKEIKKYGDLVLLKPVENISHANQAKMARYFAAALYKNEVCMIEDIDTIPLQRSFFEDITAKRNVGKLLAVGKNAYENTENRGKFPISNMTLEGNGFASLVNPNNLSFEKYIKSFIGIRVFDSKEDITNPSSNFSDESLMRVLISRWSENNVDFIDRDTDPLDQWIDRSWWPNSIDEDKLKSGHYVICNFLRPFYSNFDRIKPISDFIFDCNTQKKDVILIESKYK